MKPLLIYCDECDRDIEADNYTTREFDVSFNSQNLITFDATIECPFCRHRNRITGFLDPSGYCIK